MRLAVGEYPRMDKPTPPAGVPDDSWTFQRWNAVAGAKFYAVSCALSATFQSKLAAKIWNGWKVSDLTHPQGSAFAEEVAS